MSYILLQYTFYVNLSHGYKLDVKQIPKKLNSKEKELLKELADQPNIKKFANSDNRNFFKRFNFWFGFALF